VDQIPWVIEDFGGLFDLFPDIGFWSTRDFSVSLVEVRVKTTLISPIIFIWKHSEGGWQALCFGTGRKAFSKE